MTVHIRVQNKYAPIQGTCVIYIPYYSCLDIVLHGINIFVQYEFARDILIKHTPEFMTVHNNPGHGV